MAKKEKWGRGQSPHTIFGTMPLQSKENALFDINSALQKGVFCSFAEKGRGPDPKDPPLVLHLDIIEWSLVLMIW